MTDRGTMTVKRWLWLSIVFMLAVAVTGCGAEGATSDSAAPATPGRVEAETAATLTEDYADATSVRNQLALGALHLEGTPQALTTDQAKSLLPLWQTLKALGESSTSAPEEVEAVLDQIVGSLTEEQVAAIAALQLTNADLQAYYVEIGAAEIRTPEPGVTPQSSALKDLPAEEREAARATAQALGTPVGSGADGGAKKSDVLLDNVIQLLTERATGS